MKFLVWLRNVSSARHFFIFVVFAIGLSCLYIYALIWGVEKLNLSSAAFYGIMSVFVLHLTWILVSAVIHFVKKEWRPGIIKSILCVAYAFLIYYGYGISLFIFYGVATASNYEMHN